MGRILFFLAILFFHTGCVDGQIADPNYDPNSIIRITGINPQNGPLAGGTGITISGRNFTGVPTSITVGGNNCTNIAFVDSKT
ncbi:MAG: IPT/TIG domain-containing protein, partial [Halobacteriovoraceae bacterium]|nr:IPT/TIG domain-containing protein [Halobacteriovoraceae bacterium]